MHQQTFPVYAMEVSIYLSFLDFNIFLDGEHI